MLAEREEALEEADELDQLVTAKTESVQYDHPNHTVTVTTISDLDLSGARLLGLPQPEQGAEDQSKEEATSVEKPTKALPKKSKDPLLSQRISNLTASLHAHSRKKAKRRRPRRAQDSMKKPPRATRTSKTQRRRLTGRTRHSGE
ncbi:nucleolar protein 12 isoform X2 [Cavia porcellus]